MYLRCSYCKEKYEAHDNVIRHCIQHHQDQRVSFITVSVETDKVKFKRRDFHIKGSEIHCPPNDVTFNFKTGKIEITTKSPTKSPVRKLCKINSPSKSVHTKFYACDETTQNTELGLKANEQTLENENKIQQSDVEENDMNDALDTIGDDSYEIEDDNLLTDSHRVKAASDQLQKLLPKVTQHMTYIGILYEWVAFFNMINNGEFNAYHIAVQLFLDVVKISTVDDVHGMRYSPGVKEFWTVGQSLFRDKFIRFMSG